MPLRGLPVEFGINFFKVNAISIVASTADLITWVRIRWKDPRLMWDPLEFGNLTKTFMWIESGSGGSESSQIWTPDIYLWNHEEPMARTLSDTYATVHHTGIVRWSRPGRIKPSCKFEGLSRFPFDSLQCTLQFGSWTRNAQ